MVLNKTKGIICAVVLLFVGYVAGAYIGVPLVNSGKLSGDIGKAKLYNNATGGYANADAEKLLNDTLYQQEIGGSVALLAARVNAADSLIGATVAATGGIDSLADINKQMQSFAVKTKNAKQAFNDLMATMNSVIGGDNGGGEAYEQQLNNAVLAYTAVDNMMSVCPEYAETFLACGKASSDEKLLSLAGGWIQYGAEDALFNGTEEDIAAWQNVYADLAKDGGLAKFSIVKNFPTVSKLVSAAKLSCRSFETLSKVNNGVCGAGFIGLAKVEQMQTLSNSEKMQTLSNSEKMQTINNSNRIQTISNSNRIHTIGKVAASSRLGLKNDCLQRITGVTPPQMNSAY